MKVLLLFLIFNAVSVLAETPDNFRIGGLVVLTGQYATQGAAFREGAELAVDEINAQGGAAGRKLELIVEDTANLPTQALTAARKLLDTGKGVQAAITTSFTELGTGAAEFQKRKVPVVHLWDASPEIEAMGEHIFGIGPWIPSAGELSARYAFNQRRAKTSVTIHIHDPWSEAVTQYFTAEFEKLGGTVMRSFAFNPSDQDFRSAFTKIRALKPDIIYCPITDNIVAFYTQLKQSNVNIPVITSDVIALEHIMQAPDSFEGIAQSQIQDPSGPSMASLEGAYRQKFAKDLTLPWYVATAYDGIKLIAHCVRRASDTSAQISACIAQTKDLPGVSKTLSFNAGGSSPQLESMFEINGGKFVFRWKE